MEAPITDSTIKILLLEDDENDFRELEGLLSRVRGMAFDLDWGQEFEDGIRVLQNSNYDVCLLDSSLGSRGGVEFIKEAKKKGIKTPIIFLADGNSNDRDITALRAGAADYLVKGRIHPVFLHRAIRYALERAKSERQEKTENINNELETPPLNDCRALEDTLTRVAGLQKLIQDKMKNESNVSRWTQDAFSLTLQALTYSHNLLSKLSKNSTLTPNINLQQLVLDTVELLTPFIPKNITLSANIKRGKKFIIDGDFALLQQVLIDLIMYRIQYLPQATTISISVLSEPVSKKGKEESNNQSARYACIELQDPNLTLKSYEISQLFADKKHSGIIGASLTSVPSIIQLHNGWCALAPYSEDPRCGTIFSIYFPLVTQQNVSTPKPYVKSARANVLLIEENNSLAWIAKLYLDATGISSAIFSRPTEALAWYSTHSKEIDLVIFDMAMSDITPTECFAILKKINKDAKIALFSNENSDEVQLLLTLGALKCFQKPAHYPLIINWIFEVLEQPEN